MAKTRDETSTPNSLLSGLDYPRTYREFVTKFPDDNACLLYLKKLRWPNGFICPACNASDEPWYQTRERLVCRTCHHQTSPTSGTILDKTRTPLMTWFEVAWHITTTKNGFQPKVLNVRWVLGIRLHGQYYNATELQWYEVIVSVYRELSKLMKLL